MPSRRVERQRDRRQLVRRLTEDSGYGGSRSSFELSDDGDVMFDVENHDVGHWRGYYFFLTYPRTGLSVDIVKAHFYLEDILEIEVVEELHKDGTPHLHVLVHYGKQTVMTRSRARCNGETPNIKVVKRGDVARARGYLKKAPVNFRSTWLKGTGHDGSYQKILDRPNMESALALCQGLATRDYILYRHQLEMGLEAHYRKEIPVWKSRYTEDMFTATEEMKCWIDGMRNTEEVGRRRSLILIGPSRIGKTEWARSLGSHFYMNGYWNMGCFREDTEYGIFDDMEYSQFKYFKQFMGSQSEFTASDKYKRNGVIKYGRPCIWICNEGLEEWKLTDVMRSWINMNCYVVYVDDNLFV